MLGWVRWEYIYYLKVCRAINPYISLHLRKGPVCPYSTNFIILTVVVQKFHFHLQSKLLKHSTIYVYKCDSHTCAWMLFLTRYSFSFLFHIVFETLIASYFKGLIYLEVTFLDAAVVGTLFMRKFSSSVYLLYPSCWLFTPSASKCTMTNSTLCFFFLLHLGRCSTLPSLGATRWLGESSDSMDWFCRGSDSGISSALGRSTGWAPSAIFQGVFISLARLRGTVVFGAPSGPL